MINETFVSKPETGLQSSQDDIIYLKIEKKSIKMRSEDKIAAEQQKIVTKLKNLLSDFDAVSFAYLFGSFATGEISNHSDIDIAVYIKEDYDSFEEGLSLHHRLQVALKRDIDLVVLNSIRSYRLLKDIIYKGILLKDSENRPFYEVQKQHEIIDFFDFQRMIHAA